MSDAYMRNELIDYDINPEEDEFQDDFEPPCRYQVRVTRQQIEILLSKGNIDLEPIDVDCDSCNDIIPIFPTLILGD